MTEHTMINHEQLNEIKKHYPFLEEIIRDVDNSLLSSIGFGRIDEALLKRCYRHSEGLYGDYENIFYAVHDNKVSRLGADYSRERILGHAPLVGGELSHIKITPDYVVSAFYLTRYSTKGMEGGAKKAILTVYEQVRYYCCQYLAHPKLVDTDTGNVKGEPAGTSWQLFLVVRADAEKKAKKMIPAYFSKFKKQNKEYRNSSSYMLPAMTGHEIRNFLKRFENDSATSVILLSTDGKEISWL